MALRIKTFLLMLSLVMLTSAQAIEIAPILPCKAVAETDTLGLTELLGAIASISILVGGNGRFFRVLSREKSRPARPDRSVTISVRLLPICNFVS
jgi:hypothetical protein